jgi:DNA-binding SARP family transcriptional activator
MNSVESEPMGVHLLGGFRAAIGRQTLPLRPSTERVVAFLALRGPRMRSDLVTALWPDTPFPRALSTLRTVLWRLREDAPGLMCQTSKIMALRAESDVAMVRDWATGALDRSRDSSRYPANLGEDLLPGWDDGWLIEEREELKLLQLSALETLAQRYLVENRLAEATRAAMAAVKIDPLRQSANRLLIETHIRQGNEREAYLRYQRYQSTLMTEVGLPVGPELTSLVASVLRNRSVPESRPRHGAETLPRRG